MTDQATMQADYQLKKWHIKAAADPSIAALVNTVASATDDPIAQLAILEAAQEAFGDAPRPFGMSSKIGRIIPRRPQPFIRINNPLLPGNQFKFMLPRGLYTPADRILNRLRGNR